MSDRVEYLDLDDLLMLVEVILGENPPVRDLGLLGSAVARPQTTASGTDAYPDIWTKAGALLHPIVNNHALVDGNKRLGWLATAVFLELNRASVSTATDDQVYELVNSVAATDLSVDEVAAELCRLHGGG